MQVNIVYQDENNVYFCFYHAIRLITKHEVILFSRLANNDPAYCECAICSGELEEEDWDV